MKIRKSSKAFVTAPLSIFIGIALPIVITTAPIKNTGHFVFFHKIALATIRMTVTKSTKPSCSGCPMGCEKSRYGEIGGNIFVHSLVGCQFAERIYSDINTTFTCLNSIGYSYVHEDLENLPGLVEETLRLIG